MALLRILGSGTLVPDAARASACHMIETERSRLLLDCGTGTLHGFARNGVAWEEITHIAISHFHNDHVGDLAAVLFAYRHGMQPPRSAPLTLVGPRGFGAWLDRLAAALGPWVTEPPHPLEVIDLEEGEVYEGPDFALRCHTTPHTDESVCFRWEGEGVEIGYTGDTGPSQDVARFLAGCRVVVADCAYPDPPPYPVHPSPGTLAPMARTMAPDLLVLTHVYPGRTPDEAVEGIRAAGYEGAVIAGRDGTTIRVDREGPTVERERREG